MLYHKHLIIRAEILDPPEEIETKYMSDWFKGMVTDIGMKILMGPYVIYHDMVDNRGFTGVCIIETSHIVMHVWDECNPAIMQLDVYTCGELDIDKVFENIFVFQPTKIEYKFLDREHKLKIVGVPTKYLFDFHNMVDKQ